MVKIAVLVSGGGTNLQALIDAENRGEIPGGTLTLCVASAPGVMALTRAEAHRMKTAVVSPRDYPDQGAYSAAMLGVLRGEGIELVILAGFLTILPSEVIAAYRERIINVHPSLIPSFCGAGYYGLRVHEAALAHGVKVTGATVHLVSEVVDGGRILLQKAVEVEEGDTAKTLQRRVMEQAEWKLLPRAAALLCQEIETEKEGN